MELDQLDHLAAENLDGYLVRKDLVRTFSKQFPVPTYVVEFMLGRYCASTDEDEIEEGLEVVQKQLQKRTVKAGEEELFKSRAKEKGTVKIIDLISAKLDAKNDAYVAYLPSLQLGGIRISGKDVNENERMLTGGFYAEITLAYDSGVGQASAISPFSVRSLREIQLSSRSVLEKLARARAEFTTEQWKSFLLRSIGFEPTKFNERQVDAYFLRMVPFVERNYNMVELGPRGTGKSHLFQQVSPYARLISGGKATVAQMFVNNASGRRGLVCQYDVICFDEISGIKFDQKDGVNIMKGYMESGEFSRGKESIRADGGIVLVGNFDVDVEHQSRIGHLFGPLPPEMRDDTAFMDRIHAFLPGWDVPKVNKSMLTDHFGLVSDFLSECWTRLRSESRVSVLQNRIRFGNALSGRDTNAVNKTVSGLLKLLYPDRESEVPDEDLEWAVKIALESRRRVKEQQKYIGKEEYGNTEFSYEVVATGAVHHVPVTSREQSSDELGVDSHTTGSDDSQEAVPAAGSTPKPIGEFEGYELLQSLDSGGMAEAYLARKKGDDTVVFMKRVRNSSRDKPALEREIRIYQDLMNARIEHTFEILDFVRDDEYTAIVTECADGGDLQDYVESKGGELEPKEAKEIGLTIAIALKELHKIVVHRDLKPPNVLASRGQWKLTDFGISKNPSRLVTKRTFRTAGTLGYMSPEQFEGVEAKPSADVYSLGKLLVFLLTGQTDVDHISLPAWKSLILKCVKPVPNERPSIEQVIEELEGILV
ncbi:MAG: BREX system Lon protease-like protein BrxL [bacterium]|nr:BREX system Lon protease-like protein BrxL [bacterium]